MRKLGIHRKSAGLGRRSAVWAVCASLLLAACSGGGTAGGNGPSDGIAGSEGGNAPGSAQKREWVYLPEVVTVGDEYADYGRMQPVGDSLCYVSQGGEDESGKKTICLYSLAARELKRVPVNWPEGGDNWDVGARFFDRDGNLYLTANVYSADYSSMKRYLCKFDTEGSCLFARDITERLGRDSSLEGMSVDGQGRLYLFADGGEILLYTGDGEYHAAVSCSASGSPVSVQFRGACDGADGKYYVCIGRENADMAGGNTEEKKGEDIRCALLEIDFEGARLSEAAGNLPNVKGVCGGGGRGETAAGEGETAAGQYDFLLYDERAVYGFDLAGRKEDSGSAGEELFAWMDSDINGYCVTNLYGTEDGGFCATVEDWDNDDRAVVMLKRIKAEQAPRREELVLATVDGESSLAAMAVKFNRESDRYHLTVKGFESLTALYNAVLAKDPIDLVDLSGVNMQKLVSQGFFEDLTPYVERSNAFGRSDFVDGILEAYTFGSTLVGIPASFTLRTVVGSGTGQQAGLTLEELLASADRHPGARAFDGMTRQEMMEYIMMFNEEVFIDWDTGACRFDSDTFRALLEYGKQFPDSRETDREETSLPVQIKNGEVLFAVAELNSFRAFQEYEGMFGKDAACVGFPTPDGKGGHLLFTGDAYGIAAMSAHKEGAWEFIEEFLVREKSEAYYGNIFAASFPTLKKTFNEKAEEAIESDSRYGSRQFPELIYSDGTTFQFHALTREEVDSMLKLVPDARPYFDLEGDPVIGIILEEAAGFYSGQRSAEDVAALIQNRVQLYVNENK